MQSPTCGKCAGAMEQGFLLEAADGGVVPPEWIEGPMERSFWTLVKVKGRRRHKVTTYRCTACGYLESYAK